MTLHGCDATEPSESHTYSPQAEQVPPRRGSAGADWDESCSVGVGKLPVDAWSRTGRVSVEAASASGPVTLRSGLALMAQPAAEGTPRLPLAPVLRPVQQLDRTLCEIAERYGVSRREWVMLEMEYPGVAITCAHRSRLLLARTGTRAPCGNDACTASAVTARGTGGAHKE